jgi:nucleotide-binding universal stress UspA family protein
MVTLPERSLHFTAAPGDWLRRAPANPLRRGPIVLATDGTTRGGALVVAAQLLAARLDLPLEVISILESPASSARAGFAVQDDDARRHAREIAVSDYVSRFAGGATPPRIHVRVGDVAVEIGRFARDVSATMIIIGATPDRLLRHTESGPRMVQLLRSVPCPVLSVPSTFDSLPRVVVAAVDFGPSSVRAAQAALLLVDRGGTLLLAHVLPEMTRPASSNAPAQTEPSSNLHALFDRVRDELGPSVPSGVKIETTVIADAAVDGILTSAIHAHADLIAVGTDGPGASDRVPPGGVTQTVVRNADQAVLASPPPSR